MNTPQPLDPNSPKGREVAERLSQVLAEIRLELLQRERRESASPPRPRPAVEAA